MQRALLQHCYRHVGAPQPYDLSSLRTLGTCLGAEQLVKLPHRFVADADPRVRGRAASLLYLLVPVADADMIVSSAPNLIRCVEMATTKLKKKLLKTSGADGDAEGAAEGSSCSGDTTTRAKVNSEVNAFSQPLS